MPEMPMARYEPPRVRSARTRSGSSGCATRFSAATKAARSTTEAASMMIVTGWVQEFISEFENP
jgi:hypothetical protein